MTKRRGFTLIELLVVVAIIALLIAILLPSLSRARELSKRLVCSANVAGIGKSCKIYANDNNEQWPCPPFVTTNLSNPALPTITYMGMGDYLAAGNPPGSPPGMYNRSTESTTVTSSGMSTTRAFWMLVRSGDVTVKQFICPSSNNVADDTEEINRYYDFESLNNVSYGYQVPFGPIDTRASENLDNRMAIVADASPYRGGNIPGSATPQVNGSGSPNTTGNPPLTPNSPPNLWRVFNSPNHGGTSTGEGQNVLFIDSHAEFVTRPCVGVDKDNIYTRMYGTSGGFNSTPATGVIFPGVYGGQSPWVATPQSPGPQAYPGQNVFMGNRASSTDSMIFP
jgi:prepilin-type N-terminal cleavage/methylation domain-containing protein